MFFLITFGILTKVDLPRPDSPTTIRVNSNPRRSDLRYTWLGRLEKPKIKNDIIVSFQVCLQGHVRILYHKPIFPDGLTVLIWSRKLFVPSRFIWVMILENKSEALFLLSCQLVRSAISWFNSDLELVRTWTWANLSFGNQFRHRHLPADVLQSESETICRKNRKWLWLSYFKVILAKD